MSIFNFFKGKNNDDSGFSFEKLKQIVSKTAADLTGSVTARVEKFEEFNDLTIEETEEMLIKADMGANTAIKLCDKLRKSSIKPYEIKPFLKKEFLGILTSCPSSDINSSDEGLNIFLIAGVNGVGKTTTIGKIAYTAKQNGKKVLVAAADTFRAAAEEQLNIWSERAGADIVRKDGAEPASVVFDAIDRAKRENYDILLIDTAGRLQNKSNLMAELNKIKNIIDKKAPGCLKESLIVLDANTGQNAVRQVEEFKKFLNLSGIVLTKLDGSAKGGIIFAIANEFKLPVKLIGVGEKMTDLKVFNPEEFTEALFE
jgi:fused signal recognition particle receptor